MSKSESTNITTSELKIIVTLLICFISIAIGAAIIYYIVDIKKLEIAIWFISIIAIFSLICTQFVDSNW